ncbi:MAG: 5-formyltetrahydrofolate cyclo-ligase [Bradyrhizobium sp.]|uniref:5-formyltetrahydrofolate cyclo-ligase n=1 Tax=Bradyrhizobium sp. TaxID=376 RepID=UPI001206DC20|nr:5-formyltetrahydrofolate cyclo-ligase [Bradyrhizobium sp.]THD68492.1 MAG: 5-formyltetrahydrofolate cyclo-ligase [Bradyrhizobium sp.]
MSSSKGTLRAAALARRDALGSEDRAAAALAIAAHGLPLDIKPGTVVAGYSPIRSEIDPGPLMRKLAAAGARLALPVIVAREQPLQFRLWSIDDKLQRGALGIPEPSPDAAETIPDILLVPLAAFDRAGHRIGYGAGHYDCTLGQLRAAKNIVAIGLAFAAQEIPDSAASAHDARLDLVLTEEQAIDFRSP